MACPVAWHTGRARVPRRGGCPWLLGAAAAALALSRGGSPHGYLGPGRGHAAAAAPEASAAVQAAAAAAGPGGPSRRVISLTPAANLALWYALGQKPALAAKAVDDARAVLRAATEELRELQKTWTSFKDDAEVADAVSKVVTGNAAKILKITVPGGDSLGVDIDGMTVTQVKRRDLGWQTGDKIEQINGADVEDQDDAAKKAKKAKESGSETRVTVRRLIQSPFVTLERSLRLVYQDADTPLPEYDDIMAGVSSLRSKAGFLVDGIGTKDELRKKLDSVVKDIAQYTENNSAAPAAVETKKKTSPVSSGEELGDLFR